MGDAFFTLFRERFFTLSLDEAHIGLCYDNLKKSRRGLLVARCKALIVSEHDLLVRGLEDALSRAGIDRLDRVRAWEEAQAVIESDPPAIVVMGVHDLRHVPKEVWTYLFETPGNIAFLAVGINEDQGVLLLRREVSSVTPDVLVRLVRSVGEESENRERHHSSGG